MLAHVPKDAALIELATWDRPVEGNRVTAPRYVAYVLRPGAAALAVDLGDAAGIDALVARARKSLASPASTDVREIARSLDEQVMRPVRPLLGGARRLVVAPAGALALVPFGALVDEDGQWLVERHAISYGTSGRDLLMQDDAAPARGEPVVVAAPDFGARGEAADAAGVLARVTFPPLSGTREEADALAKVWPKATVLTGADATEAAVRAVHAPRAGAERRRDGHPAERGAIPRQPNTQRHSVSTASRCAASVAGSSCVGCSSSRARCCARRSSR